MSGHLCQCGFMSCCTQSVHVLHSPLLRRWMMMMMMTMMMIISSSVPRSVKVMSCQRVDVQHIDATSTTSHV